MFWPRTRAGSSILRQHCGRRRCVRAAALAAEPVRELRDIPGPKAWPLIGCIPDFMGRVSGFDPPNGPTMIKAHQELYQEFGDIYRQEMAGETHLSVCRPEEYIKMYRNEGNFPAGAAETLWIIERWAEQHGMHTHKKFMGRGQSWRDIRMVMQEDIISPQAARTYLPYINEACRLASKNFSSHAAAPDKFVTRVAFDMFCSLFYGVQMQTAAGSGLPADLEFVDNTTKVFHILGTSIFKPYLQWPIFRYHSIHNEFTSRMNSSYDYSRELLKRAVEESHGQPQDCKPYIVRILESGKMPEGDIKQVAAVTLLAGVDTTQSVINWNMLHLALNPEKQEKLRSELVRVLGNGPLTPEVAASMRSKLPYLRAVVRETHRVAPPSAIMTVREAPCDLVLQGFEVPKGTKVNFQVYSVQNDPRYVERPENFEPERWLPDAVEARKGTDAQVIDDKLLATPFSFGARMCLGGRVADLETYSVLARLVLDWRFTIAKEAPAWKVLQPLMSKAFPFPSFNIEKI
eukprot:TRINITY_DN6820_c1_g1_i1.p1 TRINITY_DN6820_c1_g1~~TRINITY_DN6820_c1_g1_i1.p1  ORF type:complete len:517 (+),score=45.51 TRINITY_DN6820_c1_g1_i1:118-1668(+)